MFYDMTKRDIQNEIGSIKKQLVSKYHPKKIIIFGSAAWGDPDENSDIDILIIKDDVPFYGRERIRELYRIIDSELPLDLLVYKTEEFDERLREGDPFIKLIAVKGKMIYG